MERPRHRFVLLLMLLMCSGMPLLAQAAVIYVDSAANGLSNGLSWADAFPHLQSALQVAQPGDEIWLARGTYYPSYTNDREVTFPERDGVDLYGGFIGTETARNQRNPLQNLTRLSGELGNPADPTDNSRNLFWTKAAGIEMNFDGLHFVSGYGDNTSGAGFYSHESKVSFTDCVFRDNYAAYGGAICSSTDDELTFVRCEFIDNTGLFGGAFQCYNNRKDRMRDCIFRGNSAVYEGGAVSIAENAQLDLENCRIVNNAAAEGGGIVLLPGARLRGVNVMLNGNAATAGTGGALLARDSTAVWFYNSGLVQNTASAMGGGMFAADSVRLRLHNSIVWGNSAAAGGNNVAGDTTGMGMDHCLLWGNFPGQGNMVANPQFVDLDGPDNVAGNWDDQLQLANGSPGVDQGQLMGAFRDRWDYDADGDTLEVFPVDLAGHQRVFGQAIDMGPYEYGSPLGATSENALVLRVRGPFPNPALGEAAVEIELLKPSEIEVAVLDLQGRMRLEYAEKLHAGKNLLKLSVRELRSGIYFIRMRSVQGEWTGKCWVR